LKSEKIIVANLLNAVENFFLRAFCVHVVSSVKPEIKPVQDADGEEDGASHQKAPQALRETGEDVREPCGPAGEA